MKNTSIALIQQDIQHTQFIENLNALGLTADQYYLNLNSIIFDLMQLDRSTFEKSEAATDLYYKLIQEAVIVCALTYNENEEVQHTRTDREKTQQEAEKVYRFLEQFQ